MTSHDLAATAQAMVAPGKGILAADESFGTIEKRFKSISVPNTEENRRAYRQMLFTAPGVGDYISGVIMFDETLRHTADDGTPFAGVLEKQGVIPGIKVDKGAKALAGFPGEQVTEGLDGLRERLATASRPRPASKPTRTRSPAMPRSRRSRGWYRSSSPRSSWTGTTRSSAARRSPRRR